MYRNNVSSNHKDVPSESVYKVYYFIPVIYERNSFDLIYIKLDINSKLVVYTIILFSDKYWKCLRVRKRANSLYSLLAKHFRKYTITCKPMEVSLCMASTDQLKMFFFFNFLLPSLFSKGNELCIFYYKVLVRSHSFTFG